MGAELKERHEKGEGGTMERGTRGRQEAHEEGRRHTRRAGSTRGGQEAHEEGERSWADTGKARVRSITLANIAA